MRSLLLTKGGGCSCVLTLSAIGCGCIFHDGAPGRRKGRTARLQPRAITRGRPRRSVTKGGNRGGAFFFVHLPVSQRKALFLPTRKVVNSDFMFSAYSRLLSSVLLSMVRGMCHSKVLQIVVLLRAYVGR